jgi:acetyl-CoA acetyltransferase
VRVEVTNASDLPSYSDKVAFVGVGTTDRFGTIPELDAFGMAAQAFRNALDDCGLKKDDIDGVIVGTGTGQPTPYDAMCHTLGLYPRVMLPYSNLGRLAGPSITLMASLVASGACNNLAFIYTNNARSAGQRFGGGDEGGSPMNAAYGYTSPGAAAAMHLQRYMHYFGGTEEELGAIAVAQRKHAQLNPMAVMHGRPITLEDYLSARYIAKPMRLFDYCIINDGAVVVIMTTAERSRDLKQPPVYVAGTGLRSGYSHYRFDDDWLYPAYSDVARQVFAMAGIGPEDIDVLSYYDAFSGFLPFMLEGFGFCGQGEALKWVQGGRIELGGEYPINTSGGHLSETYMQGRGILAENIRQMRGECGERQVPDAHYVLFMGTTPEASAHILRSA